MLCFNANRLMWGDCVKESNVSRARGEWVDDIDYLRNSNVSRAKDENGASAHVKIDKNLTI